MRRNQSSKTCRWKRSQSGNSCLSFYGLKIAVFPNPRGDGWSVSIGQNNGPPAYSNCATEAEARVAAEQAFLRLKATREFKAPTPALEPLHQRLGSLLVAGRLRPEFEGCFRELTGRRQREAERADLFHLDLHDDGRGAAYWIPHSHGAVIREETVHCRLIVSQWWFDRAEPAQ
jgi:hypothetical protein